MVPCSSPEIRAYRQRAREVPRSLVCSYRGVEIEVATGRVSHRLTSDGPPLDSRSRLKLDRVVGT